MHTVLLIHVSLSRTADTSKQDPLICSHPLNYQSLFVEYLINEDQEVAFLYSLLVAFCGKNGRMTIFNT